MMKMEIKWYLIVEIKFSGRVSGRCRGALGTRTSNVPIRQLSFMILIKMIIHTEYIIIAYCL